MAEILVRNVEERVIRRLKARALKKGRSLQAEVKSILEETAQRDKLDMHAARRLADFIRNGIEKRVGGPLDDSAAIIRKDRDQRVRRLDQSE